MPGRKKATKATAATQPKKRETKANEKKEQRVTRGSQKNSSKKNAFSMSMRMEDDVEAIGIAELYEEINTNFVSKLLCFLRGEANHVSSHAEFTKVYQLIIH